MALDWTSAYAAIHAKGEAVFPPACLHYVLEGVRKAALEPRSANGALTPEQIVGDFRSRAQRDFGILLCDVLDDWGMKYPADLGDAVLLLGRFDLLSLSPSDTREAFAADGRPLFTEAPEDMTGAAGDEPAHRITGTNLGEDA